MDKMNEIDKPYNFKAIDETETDLCRLLWKCVALQAILDARTKSQKPENQAIKRSAIDWISAKGDDAIDFEMVLEFADLDAGLIQEVFIDLAHDRREGIDFRSMKRENPENRGQQKRSNYLRRIRYHKKVKAEMELELVD